MDIWVSPVDSGKKHLPKQIEEIQEFLTQDSWKRDFQKSCYTYCVGSVVDVTTSLKVPW
jgi:hypothetical protein